MKGKEDSMPEKINGKKLTKKEHRQWKKVKEKSGPASATAAVKKGRSKGKGAK